MEEILEGLGVKYLVLPSMNEVLPMWLDKFGFEMLTEHEHEVGQICSGLVGSLR